MHDLTSKQFDAVRDAVLGGLEWDGERGGMEFENDAVIDLIETIAHRLSPDDVFDDNQLDRWATDNDYRLPGRGDGV